MKKIRLFIALIILVLTFPTVCSAKKNVFDVPKTISVNDYAKILSDNTKEYIQNSNDELFEKVGAKIIFVTVQSTDGERIDLYASKIYDSWGIENIGNSNSVFVLFSANDMQYWVIVSDNIKSSLNTNKVNEYLLKYTEPDFSKKSFDSAAKKTYDIFKDWYDSNYRSPIPVEGGSGGNTKGGFDLLGLIGIILKVVAVIILVALIVVIIFIFVKREIRLRKLSQKRKK